MFRWKSGIRCVAASLFMVITTQVYATATEDFKQGVKAFKAENHALAVEKFESARQQGIRSPALYYNLGSAYFKLKNYKQAERYFSELRKVPKMKDLAEYNLGLIAYKQKEYSQSRKYFQSVKRNTQDHKLYFLAKQKLKENKPASKKKSAAKAVSVYLNGSVGSDSNINFAPVGIGSEESGSYFDMQASVDYLFMGKPSNGWVAEAALYTIRYSATNNFSKGTFDQDQTGVSIKKTQKLASWSTHFKVGFDKLTYGPSDYQSIINMELKGRRKLSKTDRLYLRYVYEDISSDDTRFDYLEGWKQRLRAEFRRYNKKNSTQVYYELELNDRNDLVTNAGDEFNFSPTRHTIRGKYILSLNKTWQITGDLAYRKSDYPATATQARNDDRMKAAVYANYRFDKTMKLKFKFEYTDNASTDNIYIYDRQVLSLSLSKLF